MEGEENQPQNLKWLTPLAKLSIPMNKTEKQTAAVINELLSCISTYVLSSMKSMHAVSQKLIDRFYSKKCIKKMIT